MKGLVTRTPIHARLTGRAILAGPCSEARGGSRRCCFTMRSSQPAGLPRAAKSADQCSGSLH